MQKISIETCHKKKKKAKREYGRIYIYLYNIKMSKKTLKFNNIEINNKEFHASKKPIAFKFNWHRKINSIWQI